VGNCGRSLPPNFAAWSAKFIAERARVGFHAVTTLCLRRQIVGAQLLLLPFGDIAEAWGATLTVEASARGCRIVIFIGTLSQQNVESRVGEANISEPQLFAPRNDRLRARDAPRCVFPGDLCEMPDYIARC
jgi:hypothetical protein